MMKNKAVSVSEVSDLTGRLDIPGKNHDIAKVANIPNNANFSTITPPTQAAPTTMVQITNPTHRPALCLSPLSTPIAESIESLPLRIHILLVPNAIIAIDARAKFTQPSVVGMFENTVDGSRPSEI